MTQWWVLILVPASHIISLDIGFMPSTVSVLLALCMVIMMLCSEGSTTPTTPSYIFLVSHPKCIINDPIKPIKNTVYIITDFVRDAFCQLYTAKNAYSYPTDHITTTSLLREANYIDLLQKYLVFLASAPKGNPCSLRGPYWESY